MFERIIFLVHSYNNPYNQLYEVPFYQNVSEGLAHRYINVPMDMILKGIIKSLKANDPVCFSTEIRYAKDREKGIFDDALFDTKTFYGEEENFTRAERLEYGDIEPAHMMVFTGLEEASRLQVLNSWSKEFGKNGYFSMSYQYLQNYLMRAVIKKEHLDEALRDLWENGSSTKLTVEDVAL